MLTTGMCLVIDTALSAPLQIAFGNDNTLVILVLLLPPPPLSVIQPLATVERNFYPPWTTTTVAVIIIVDLVLVTTSTYRRPSRMYFETSTRLSLTITMYNKTPHKRSS